MTTSVQNRAGVCVALALALLTVAVYWPVRSCGFINYDDPNYVTDNPYVRAGFTWDGMGWAFRSDHASNWHPLTWLSHMLDCQVFGLKAGWHHLTNLLFHVANTLLLYWVFKRMTGDLWRSAFVAALFALHPLHVESVAWIAERKDVLSTFFFLLTLLAYRRYVQDRIRGQGSGVGTGASHIAQPATRYYLLALLCFALGLMSKPMVVTLPFVLLLLDYWPLGRFQLSTLRRLLGEKLPFFGLSLVSCAVTILAQHHGGAVATLEQIPTHVRLANATISYARYLVTMLWPSKLAVFYPYPNALSTWQVAVAMLLLVAITVGVIAARRRARYLAFGWFWYLGTLVPVIGLVQVGWHAVADRYTYIPLIGVFVMVAWGAADLLARRRLHRFALASIALVGLVACALGTRAQLDHWKTSITLFTHAVAVTEGNSLAHNNLGTAYDAEGKFDKALTHFAQALEMRPDYALAHANTAMSLARQGKTSEALTHLAEVIRLNLNRGDVPDNLGLTLLNEGKTDEAMQHFSKVLQATPAHFEPQYILGYLFLQGGDLAKAALHYALALRLKPGHTNARNSYGTVLARQGRFDEAIREFREVLRLAPGFALAHCNLGNAFAARGDFIQAIAGYQAAVQLNPNSLEAHSGLGFALARQGKMDEALPHVRRALELGADPAETHRQLGNLFCHQGRTVEGIAQLREALRGQPDLPGALNDLAWILATHPDAQFRNGAEAVQLAGRAVALTGGQMAGTLDTLAAAYAEAGRFTDAVEIAQRALDQAQKQAQNDLASQIRGHLQLYQSQHALRE